jgi:SPP1 family predicted phage head-tail adaptor
MIGDMKHRVLLQECVLAPDGGGGFAEAWQDLAEEAEVYAAITPLSGAEQLRFHQLATSVTHRITLRFRADVTAAMRIIKDDVIYDIASATDRDCAGQYLDILAVVRAPA